MYFIFLLIRNMLFLLYINIYKNMFQKTASNATIRDLCKEDKKRVSDLINELAR